jgi:hypothetical protein
MSWAIDNAGPPRTKQKQNVIPNQSVPDGTLFLVIASQRVGAKRRPMTGSAKQSKEAKRKNGLLRRFRSSQ